MNHKFQEKDFETNADLSFLGNISKDFSGENMKNTGQYGFVYVFSVDCGSIFAGEILVFINT